MGVATGTRLESAVAVSCRRNNRRADWRRNSGLDRSHDAAGLDWRPPCYLRPWQSDAARIMPIKSVGAVADAGASFLNGLLSGAVGFTGLVIDTWCRLRAWPKEIQRPVFQYVGLFVFVISAFCLGARGAINDNTFSLFVVSLPAVLIGTWLGNKVRDQVDEAGMRKIVLDSGHGVGICADSSQIVSVSILGGVR